TTPVTGSITIPATATLGATRMRVMMKYSTAPTSPCGTYTYGQVEDYTVNIMSTAKENAAIVNPTKELSIYPNPVKGSTLNITNADSSEFSIYDLSGKQISNGKISDNTVSVNALPKGVYLIKVGNVSKKFIKE
ncbi:MAG TPA: GEVED domain-containing protein, partial [Kaistella sp.]|nr:GEVED domain-containing protein [Kaistella sp.]